ncbi:MAG TPA: signal peptidase I [Acidimicrobiales bacterium]|nr:signal peptidase I [Acidimicrobiales bacterium]
MTRDPNDPAVAVDEPPSDTPSAGVGAPGATDVTSDSSDGTLGAGGGPAGPSGPDGPTGSDEPGGPADAAAAAPKRSSGARWIREGVIVVVVAVLFAVLLRAFVVQTFYIPSGSMEPTLQIGDRILVNKLSYDLHGVHQGDIVVFSRPPAENCGGPEVNDLVKRVIGLPGQTISLTNGYVYIDGKHLDESWLPSQEQGITNPGPGGTAYSLAKPYHIPANDYFVMGDNRGDSCDSRYWGPIPKSLIVGKVEVRVWPLSSFRFF